MAFIRLYRLSFAIGGAILLTIALTVVSLALYNITGTSKLDLSRPGYDNARKLVKKNDINNDDEFKSNGPINPDIVKEYLKQYDKQTNELDSYDNFSQKLLDDTVLGLTLEQTAPSDGANP